MLSLEQRNQYADPREEPRSGIDLMPVFFLVPEEVLVTLTGQFMRDGKSLVENVILGVSRARQPIAIPPLALPLILL